MTTVSIGACLKVNGPAPTPASMKTTDSPIQRRATRRLARHMHRSASP